MLRSSSKCLGTFCVHFWFSSPWHATTPRLRHKLRADARMLTGFKLNTSCCRRSHSIVATNFSVLEKMTRHRPVRPIMMDYVPSAQYAREDINSTNYDLSDLCIKHIETHIKSAELYRAKLAELLTNSRKAGTIPPLTTIAMNSMINSLREDPSPSNFETVMKHCPESLLGAMIDSPKLHYTSMLRFSEQKGWDKLKDDSKRDIWILKNEYFVRADGTDWGLLNLDDADIVFGHSSKLVENETGEPIYREITRKIAPTSGLQYLDQKRTRTIKIQPSTAAFKKTFDRLMGGALDGLDWSNILVAGGMPLSTLLCVDESMDEKFKSNDIDMYIYGLNPTQANEKIKHIANIWKKNLKPDEDFVMIKNARTVTLIGTFPHRRVQIIMKMIKNPAAVLLNFDLDQVAIGYTGDNVLLLPRCARALETGYAIFTLDMIHGHHLNERRETQESRLLKYAQRGFGVRILPEFCQMVEIDFSKRRVTHPFIDQAVGDLGGSHRYWYRHEAPETPDVVSGIQAVRRVFAAGEDMVHRFYIGRTEVSAPEDYDDEDGFYSDPEDQNTYNHSDYYLFDWVDPDTGDKMRLPKGQFSSIDTYRSGVGAPHGKRGLGSLEMHARHCALFRFEQEKKMIVDYNTLASTTYDVESYDMLPQYHWNSSFTPKTFMGAIDDYNENLFQKFCSVLESDPAIEASVLGPRGSYNRAYESGWKSHLKGYLTRRIRRIAYSKDINELVDRFQIVLPVVVNYRLEEWIKETFAKALDDAGIPSHQHDILIPVHKSGMGDGRLPDTTESDDENVRYWVIDSTTVWAGLDRRIDEIFEVLWVLSLSNDLVSDHSLGYGSRADAAKEWYQLVATILLRRVTKLSIQQLGISRVGRSANKVGEDDDESGAEGEGLSREFIEPRIPEDINPLEIPNERDQYLFTKWLTERPIEIYRSYQYEVHNSYRESNNAVPPPPIMYLREGADYSGTEWTDWPEDSPGFEPVATFRPQPRRKIQSSDAEGEETGGGEDAEGEAAPAEDPAAEGEEEAPRGLKRQRESVDVMDMLRPSGPGASFASFGNDTAMADADNHGEGEGAGPSSTA
ncbi:hypothetical protein TWF225_007775 [Orbilia oligospora]|uniref:Uncharacterized protein n=2 Tax=Orbilia oligospora TaxID=2813651 RepID=A0A7C8P792_ORBOL|nr:hypothetical protein TWF751_010673 [Orbilia oligospora]KAF3178747.1 hypothetical protein TWF225_007775 [Orbilia oligospora]KAF3235839.1 hypothetical protein TWF217_002852 [Orbilia oligospora]KAF3242095.1 hypothetical protein TWF128_010574 [Orbilia oligospora]TGJ65651.1 hypothetical protein EYR41_009604 [Orbilia oligospora]